MPFSGRRRKGEEKVTEGQSKTPDYAVSCTAQRYEVLDAFVFVVTLSVVPKNEKKEDGELESYSIRAFG